MKCEILTVLLHNIVKHFTYYIPNIKNNFVRLNNRIKTKIIVA